MPANGMFSSKTPLTSEKKGKIIIFGLDSVTELSLYCSHETKQAKPLLGDCAKNRKSL
jgi:hypothetical protein